MNRVFLVGFLLMSSLSLMAQDKEMIARAYFIKAENAYNSQMFQETLILLAHAEENLENTNSKILYLKIKSLTHLEENQSNIFLIIENINSFFKITDPNNENYIDKYSEITSLYIDYNEKKNIIDSISYEKNKILEKEENAFLLIKNSLNLDSIDNFITTYSHSSHRHEVNLRYDSLQKLNVYQKKFVYYSEGGIQEKGMWENGARNGTTLWYRPNGTLCFEYTYANDVLEGPFIEYDVHEKVRLIGAFQKGKESGEWKEFQDSKLISTYFYNRGKIVKHNK